MSAVINCLYYYDYDYDYDYYCSYSSCYHYGTIIISVIILSYRIVIRLVLLLNIIIKLFINVINDIDICVIITFCIY